MLILALDTSSAAGSAAVVRDGDIVAERAGDVSRTHGERLPRELMTVLEDAHLRIDEIDAFAIATGPGSFTGLRVGIATMQGLALAQDKRVVPVSTFEALGASLQPPIPNLQLPIPNLQLPIPNLQLPIPNLQLPTSNLQLPTSNLQPPASNLQPPASAPIAIWVDAHRGEVFATLYAADGTTVLHPPTSLAPAATLDVWTAALGALDAVRFAGDGAIKYRDAIEARLGVRAGIPAAVPLLAGTIGRIAARHPERAVRPHAVVPLYVRRPDAELARDRGRRAGGD